MKARGLVNTVIDNLPIELHLPGYNFCGPGTKLKNRLARGDKGVNLLDEACKRHDIAYDNFSDIDNRHKADIELMKQAKQRLRSQDAGKGEKVASWLVNKVMKAKIRTGAGVKKFNSIVSKIRRGISKLKNKSNKSAIKYAYAAAKKIVGKTNRLRLPRVIPVPKSGGVLPLIPIFAGLSALGSLAGGASAIAKTVNDFLSAKKSFSQNKPKESIALGKGLYVKPYKNGHGIYINNAKN